MCVCVGVCASARERKKKNSVHRDGVCICACGLVCATGFFTHTHRQLVIMPKTKAREINLMTSAALHSIYFT